MRHLTNYRTLLVLLLVLVLAACAAPLVTPTAPEEPAVAPAPTLAPTNAPVPTSTPAPLTPSEVVTRMAERFSAGDLEGGLGYWADNAIWYIIGLPPNGFEMIQSKDGIRAEFENEIAAHLTWEIDPQSVVGNVVTSHDKTWLDFTRQIGVAPVEASGQYLIEDGKIVEYTWTATEDSVTRLMAALAEAMPSEPEAAPEAAAPALEPVSELVVTIADGTCSIEAPVALKAGEIQVTFDVQDQDKEAYAVTFMTIDEGKTFMDLMASTTGLPPNWANLLHYEEIGPASVKTYTISADEGPLYAICWSRPPDHPIGNFGPFEVVPRAETSAAGSGVQ